MTHFYFLVNLRRFVIRQTRPSCVQSRACASFFLWHACATMSVGASAYRDRARNKHEVFSNPYLEQFPRPLEAFLLHIAPRVVGPLPLREGPRHPQEGHASHSAARRLGKGASPCWQHVMRIPLPEARALSDDARGAGGVFHDLTPSPSPAVAGRSRDENCPPKAMVSYIVLAVGCFP